MIAWLHHAVLAVYHCSIDEWQVPNNLAQASAHLSNNERVLYSMP
jgi:hypothetical protein